MYFDNSPPAWSVLMKLRVDGVDLELSGFDADELRDVVRPLGTAVDERLRRTPVKARLRLGICGPPGAGKTIFAMRLVDWLRGRELSTAAALFICRSTAIICATTRSTACSAMATAIRK